MMMLFHSVVPKPFLAETFATVIFLINRLPSRSLDFQSPFSTLYGTFPNYYSLRVFGSKCYPYTWDTKQNKFDPKTPPCIFLGYSNQHNGYKCYHPLTGHNYISRHVVFYELMFPQRTWESSHTASI